MNGAHALIETLVRSGLDVCFANPGTSEMQLVQAIDQIPGMHPILALFEGVVTGAADGYARMARKPACTLLHLGPGLANGVANLHNARKAHTPVVNVVGDHALHHVRFDAPLTSDLEGIARPVSHWVRSAQSPAELAALGAEAVAVAGTVPGRIATLLAPADSAWTDLPADYRAPAVQAAAALPQVPSHQIDAAAKALRQARNPVILLGGEGLVGEGAFHAGRIAAALPVRLHAETFNRRLERGAGRVPISILPYFGERVLETLAGADLILLAGSKRPVAFFAYPGKPSVLVPEGCDVVPLAGPTDDAAAALRALADALQAPASPSRFQTAVEIPRATGTLTPQLVAQVVGRTLPEGAIVIDEAITCSLPCQMATLGAPAHDWLQLMGGSIGDGLPLAVGAAVACRDRKVICLEGDGSAMYTVQALWTMAREGLDVINVILANRSYTVLNIEFERVGVGSPGPRALSMLDLGNPSLRWTDLARGMGVNAARAETAEEFEQILRSMLGTRGPHVIEAVI
ncbi:MAG: acetolactate synthase large subunit [Gammaproteobacteria bacterium]|nr:acetolactate synthase large subunit [Gammaproteobacteria bacterium]